MLLNFVDNEFYSWYIIDLQNLISSSKQIGILLIVNTIISVLIDVKA